MDLINDKKNKHLWIRKGMLIHIWSLRVYSVTSENHEVFFFFFFFSLS